jgi:hypothetical protein
VFLYCSPARRADRKEYKVLWVDSETRRDGAALDGVVASPRGCREKGHGCGRDDASAEAYQLPEDLEPGAQAAGGRTQRRRRRPACLRYEAGTWSS